jgi:asparagine synthase (glutamine-hydrolysing)
MSVQAGIWNFDGAPVDRTILDTISAQTAEYGSDGEAMHIDGSVGMLYRSFHTTFESRKEQQPHLFGHGKVMTWDGRLDNRGELISEMPLNPESGDASIVAAAFERWGMDSFKKLIGDWALSIWNPHERELILARDYIGIRQLFYYAKPHGITWCSHLAPLALCGDQFTLSHKYIAGYLTSCPDADLTPYSEIRSVPPAASLCFRGSKSLARTYWAFNPTPAIRCKSDREYEECFRHLLRSSVRRRLRTDTPILAELSGGLDSSSIVCMADDIRAKENLNAKCIDTFSYYDSKEPEDNDRIHVAIIEEWRGRSGSSADLLGSGSSLPLLSDSFCATPGFGSRAEIKHALSRLLEARRYGVLLSGVGGDEVNGQVLDPCIELATQLAHFQLRKAAKHLVAWSMLMRRPLLQLLFRSLAQFLPVSLRVWLTQAGRLEPWIGRHFASTYHLRTRQVQTMDGWWFSRPHIRDAVDTFIRLSKRMTYVAPSVIEPRYPYLDRDLVEFLLTVPFDQLLRPGDRRSLMRRALKEFLPEAILQRRTKASNVRCYSAALEQNWDLVNNIFSAPLISHLGYVHRDYFVQALVAMKNGQLPPNVVRLLKALSLELWLANPHTRKVLVLPVDDGPVIPDLKETMFITSERRKNHDLHEADSYGVR